MNAIKLACLALALAQITPAAPAATPATSPDPEGRRAVLVTGASTGIGRKITERLAASGFFVYAGARREADLEELDAIENVDAVRLDVTKPDEIAATVETVRKAGRGLYAVVNNAGVAIVGPVLETKEEDFDFLFDVNVYGPFRITKAFGPLVVESKGRIVNIGSISGILSAKDLAAYSMSKHAIEAFTDSLAAEVAPLGVSVSVIEPGNYRSEIGASAAKRAGVTNRMADRSQYKEPDEVADAALRALTAPVPQRRYMVVPDQAEAERTIRKQIEELVQLNHDQPYAYDRKALVEMLDAALAPPAVQP
jgi:NAD(P)-dependent dehydrogenase (short-subunit alcohol dehydrogenase family)